ncbi:MAG: hypothetical protein WCK49_10200, partial [Myxococcaceae bacterium]
SSEAPYNMALFCFSSVREIESAFTSLIPSAGSTSASNSRKSIFSTFESRATTEEISRKTNAESLLSKDERLPT